MSNFDTSVDKEMQKDALTLLYFKLRPSPTQNKISLLSKMDEYVQLSRSAKEVKTRKFNELETTLKFDIYRVIEGDLFDEIRGSLAIPTEALENYKTLSDEKRSLFKKCVGAVHHKRKKTLTAVKQKTIA